MTREQRTRTVVLLSGGLDSAANLAFAAERDLPVLALTADYGQRAAASEIRAARSFAEYYDVRHDVVDLRWLGALGGSALTESRSSIPDLARADLDDLTRARETARAVWVPNRNGVLIATAAAYAERLGAERVAVGFNVEEAATFADNSQEFLERSTRGLELSTSTQVQVYSYTTALNKREIVERLRKLDRPFPFDRIWSCYQGMATACGACESCRRLARALAQESGV